jgi:sulfur-carrier protein
VRVRIPSPLHAYTEGRAEVEADGGTLGELVADLDARFPGIRFRMIDEHDRVRPHVRFFVDQEMVRGLDHRLRLGADVQIVCAISGG